VRQVDQTSLREVFRCVTFCSALLCVSLEKFLGCVNIASSRRFKDLQERHLDLRPGPTIPGYLERIVRVFLAGLGERHEVFNLVDEVEFSNIQVLSVPDPVENCAVV
jgi:hypothetical protein